MLINEAKIYLTEIYRDVSVSQGQSGGWVHRWWHQWLEAVSIDSIFHLALRRISNSCYHEPVWSGRRVSCLPAIKTLSSAGATTNFNHSWRSSPSTFSLSEHKHYQITMANSSQTYYDIRITYFTSQTQSQTFISAYYPGDLWGSPYS